jgi:hypothetical protein
LVVTSQGDKWKECIKIPTSSDVTMEDIKIRVQMESDIPSINLAILFLVWLGLPFKTLFFRTRKII